MEIETSPIDLDLECIVVFPGYSTDVNKKLESVTMNYKRSLPKNIPVIITPELTDLIKYSFNRIVVLYPKKDDLTAKEFARQVYDKMVVEGWLRCTLISHYPMIDLVKCALKNYRINICGSITV